MKKLFFSIALVASLGVAVFSITPTEINAAGGGWDCFDNGAPWLGCPQESVENCYCGDLIIYG